MTHPLSSPGQGEGRDGVSLRLVWPQWQGAGTSAVRALAPEFPADLARRGYAVGSAVLAAVLPPHDGPTVTVPVTMSDDGLDERDGIEAKTVIADQLAAALQLIGRHDPARIATLGGDCSVSVAPFAALARRYGQDLAVVWIDSHPDIGTPRSRYPGFHAMAVASLTGHGDAAVQALLPATVSPGRVALAGIHAWAQADFANLARWGIAWFGPGDLRESTGPLLDWVAATGCSRAAIHFDVDVIDSNQIVLGLGAEPDGLTSAQARRIVADLDAAVEIVGFTVAEFIPRQVICLQQILEGFPLISAKAAG